VLHGFGRVRIRLGPQIQTRRPADPVQVRDAVVSSVDLKLRWVGGPAVFHV